jgi:hypothetical protein
MHNMRGEGAFAFPTTEAFRIFAIYEVLDEGYEKDENIRWNTRLV